jgi:hypothetical protein
MILITAVNKHSEEPDVSLVSKHRGREVSVEGGSAAITVPTMERTYWLAHAKDIGICELPVDLIRRPDKR